MSDIRCPKCKSENWSCWDERVEWFQDKETEEFFESPVGYLVCKDCGQSYAHYDLENVVWIGDEGDLYHGWYE